CTSSLQVVVAPLRTVIFEGHEVSDRAIGLLALRLCHNDHFRARRLHVRRSEFLTVIVAPPIPPRLRGIGSDPHGRPYVAKCHTSSLNTEIAVREVDNNSVAG